MTKLRRRRMVLIAMDDDNDDYGSSRSSSNDRQLDCGRCGLPPTVTMCILSGW